MAFWDLPIVWTALGLTLLLAAAEGVRGAVPALRRIGVPASIVAGMLGLLLGPGVLGVLPLDVSLLEAGVYHALAIVFIAVSLQSPSDTPSGPSARTMAFGITTMVALQTFVGLAVILGLGLLVGHLHPGFGLLLPLAFEQGPGQALSLGTAWEPTGFTDGGQIGLVVAAIGFGWSVGVGVPLVAWGRARGLVSRGYDAEAPQARAAKDTAALPPGSLELLARQVVAIGLVYAATWGVCALLYQALSAAVPDIASMVWGFHFMIGALLAMAARPLFRPLGAPLDDVLLGRIAGVTVDLATCAALAAVTIGVFRANWIPILLVTTIGGLTTLLAAVWFALRAWREAPFEHCVLWFGMSTGTLPMGLALLRIVDPELRSPAPVSAVLGSAIAIAGVAPIVLLIHPIPILGWEAAWPASGWTALGLSGLYFAVTVGLWWRFGGLGLAAPPKEQAAWT